MKFRLFPPGEFLMGSTPEETKADLKVATGLGVTWVREEIESEAPRHRVVLTKPNYVGVTEVTQTQYERVKTPEATLYASLLRQIRDKGTDATFRKTGRGLFVLNR